MRKIIGFCLVALFFWTGFAQGETGKVKGVVSAGTSYESGIFGKGIIIGRIVSREKAAFQQDETSACLILQSPYADFSREKTGEPLPENIKVYKEKEGVVTDNTSVWLRDSLPARLRCPVAKFDSGATYYVDYKVLNYLYYSLKELTFPPKDGTIEMFLKLSWKTPNKPTLYPGLFDLLSDPADYSKGRLEVEIGRGPHFLCLHAQPGSVDQNIDIYSVLKWNPGTWHHVAFVWENDAYRLYVDGEKTGEGKFQGGFTEPWQKVVVGSINDNPNFYGARLFATIDEFRLSSVARTIEEIAANASGAGELSCDEKTVILCHFEGTTDGESGLK